MNGQLQFFDQREYRQPVAPSTRYQGSKAKLVDWIWFNIKDIDFTTALDAFGGTGSVSYHLKSRGKHVTFNDHLQFNAMSAKAFIENHSCQLTHEDVELLQVRSPDRHYDSFIERTFDDIYFLKDENHWLDTVAQNILDMKNEHKQALAYHALFQSCIIKRPYNLFHRKNLYMRTAAVARGFGNKSTWDRSFPSHFRDFVTEANEAVFDSSSPCSVLCKDALEVEGSFDLVYIDTPYLNSRGIGVDYFSFYHFLEGLMAYDSWGTRIDYRRKNRPLKGTLSPWSDGKRSARAFEDLFAKYKKSKLAISYRSDGTPSEQELLRSLKRVKPQAKLLHYGSYKYVLSTNGSSKEILLVAE